MYFTATKDFPMAANLYRVKPGGAIERLTQGEGSHQVSLSPDGKNYLTSWSDIHTPTKVKLYAADGKLVRVVDSNPVYRLKEYRFGPIERLHVRTKDGFLLEGELTLPPDLDPSKKYPVWFHDLRRAAHAHDKRRLGGRADRRPGARGRRVSSSFISIPEAPAAKGLSPPGRLISTWACRNWRTSRTGSPGSSKGPTSTALASA